MEEKRSAGKERTSGNRSMTRKRRLPHRNEEIFLGWDDDWNERARTNEAVQVEKPGERGRCFGQPCPRSRALVSLVSHRCKVAGRCACALSGAETPGAPAGGSGAEGATNAVFPFHCCCCCCCCRGEPPPPSVHPGKNPCCCCWWWWRAECPPPGVAVVRQ